MNWGKGIAIALILFVGFIVTLVTIIVSQDVDLVSEDYYAKEMSYQDEINGIQAGNDEPKITVIKKREQVVVTVPETTNAKSIVLNFYRANNKDLDKEFTINNTKMLVIPKSDFQKGNYSVRAEYIKEGKTIIQKFEIEI